MASRSTTDSFGKKDRKKFEKNRLEFIKERHHELVLKPRYSIAEGWDEDGEDDIGAYDLEQEHYRAVREVCDLDSI